METAYGYLKVVNEKTARQFQRFVQELMIYALRLVM